MSGNTIIQNSLDNDNQITVGDAIKALVKKHGQSTLGIFILEQALLEATGGKSVLVDGRLIHDMSLYQELEQTEQEILERWRNGQ